MSEDRIRYNGKSYVPEGGVDIGLGCFVVFLLGLLFTLCIGITCALDQRNIYIDFFLNDRLADGGFVFQQIYIKLCLIYSVPGGWLKAAFDWAFNSVWQNTWTAYPHVNTLLATAATGVIPCFIIFFRRNVLSRLLASTIVGIALLWACYSILPFSALFLVAALGWVKPESESQSWKRILKLCAIREKLHRVFGQTQIRWFIAPWIILGLPLALFYYGLLACIMGKGVVSYGMENIHWLFAK